MELNRLKEKIPREVYESIIKKGINGLRPAQTKALNAGLLEGKNLLVCTPTGSGKTLVAEIAALNSILSKKGKAIYIVPLKALANEKSNEFREKYPSIKIALSIGDFDSSDSYLAEYDLIITTSEKMDSLVRHHCPWLAGIRCVVFDEVHLLNDPGRGPTLEILITLLRETIKEAQIIALSATIGNPERLAEWLDANLVMDNWRPVKLYKGVYLEGEVEFED